MAMTRRPTIDDVDSKTGERKYQTFDEYAEASDAWIRASAIQDVKDMVAAGLIVLPEKEKETRGHISPWPGIGFGCAMAMILSFQLNHSIPWMILHGICSWIYVIYRAWQGNY